VRDDFCRAEQFYLRRDRPRPTSRSVRDDNFGSDRFDCTGDGREQGLRPGDRIGAAREGAKVVAVARSAESLASLRVEREALLLPLHPGSTVITMSSGAAVAGSRSAVATPGPRPRSGFITGYAPGAYLLTPAGLSRLG